MEKNDVKKTVLEHKLSMLREASNPITLWWVSSVVFCGSIIGAIIFNIGKFTVLSPIILTGTFIIIILFFSTIILFGIYTLFKIRKLEKEINDIIDQSKIEIFFKSSEAAVLKMALIFGCISFVFCIAITIMLWINIVSM